MASSARTKAFDFDPWRTIYATLSLALIIACFAAPARAQTQGLPDASENTQCWDTLHNVSRDRHRGQGKVDATGDYAGQHAGSGEARKVQGPGAEPKDSTGVTVGQNNQGRQTGVASVRPPGLPNC